MIVTIGALATAATLLATAGGAQTGAGPKALTTLQRTERVLATAPATTLQRAQRALLTTHTSGEFAPRVRARCRYQCRCYYVNRTQRSCEHTLVLDCAGKLCSRCVGTAKSQARRSCRARGPVRRCGCPFQRLKLKP